MKLGRHDIYFCENCGGIGVGKYPSSLCRHLREKHGLNVIYNSKNQAIVWIGDDRICKICGKKIPKKRHLLHDFEGKRHSDYYVDSRQIDNHLKEHAKYYLDGKPFRTIISFLHAIDKEHAVHISYVKGISRKKVFFDGILNKNKQ